MLSTDLCSILVVMMCRPFSRWEKATPLMAWFTDSVPPEVKTMS